MLRSDKALALMKYTRIDKNGCWLWTRASRRDGYGVVWNGQKVVGVHRLMFSLMNPRVDIAGLCVCHHCDVKLCINPDHLYPGTKSDNYRDALNRGQIVPKNGTENYKAKLSDEQVRTIRRLVGQGIGKRELGRRFGIDHSQVVRISKRSTWKHI